MPDPSAGTDWTDREIDLIVADYFDMLGMELRGEVFVKAQRNAALQELVGRGRGSIEFKHQNISAVLFRLGMPWIEGYKPMAKLPARSGRWPRAPHRPRSLALREPYYGRNGIRSA